MEKNKIWISSYYARRIKLLEEAYKKAKKISRDEDFYETIIEFCGMRVIAISLKCDSFLPHWKGFEVNLDKMLEYLIKKLSTFSIMSGIYSLINNDEILDEEFEKSYSKEVLKNE